MNTASKLIVPAAALAIVALTAPATAKPGALHGVAAGVDALDAGSVVEVQHKRERRGRKGYREHYRGPRAHAPAYEAPPQWGYRTSTGQWYPYCVIDLGYGRVEACGGSTPP